jgi:uncharacterized protein YndB with AHSA1/START domain
MRIVKAGAIAAGALLLLVLTIAGVGLLLPQAHVETRSALVAAPPERVFATIADVAAHAAWRPSLGGVEPLPPTDGRPRWIEIHGGDRITMEMVEQQPPVRLVTRIADPDLPFGGTWTFALAPEAGGTRVTITEQGEIHHPIFRALARFVFGHAGTMETYLRELQARLR